MAKSIFILDHEETSLTLQQLFDFNANNRKENLIKLINYLKRSLSGAGGNITLESRVGEIQAQATITSTGAAVADETLTINGVTLTAKASGTVANTFVLSSTVATQATNIAGAINASASAGLLNVTATSSAGVVTLTCDIPGTVGNAMTLSEAMTNVAVSGANFTGGASDLDVTWTA